MKKSKSTKLENMLPMSDLKVSNFSTSKLIPDPDNVRLHDDRSIETIARSLSRFGFRKPIVAHERTNIVYAGNGILEAALKLGIKTVPVAWIPAEIPTEVCRAFSIMDNRSSELSAWNMTSLENELERLKDEFERLDMGFSDADILEMFPDLAKMKLNELNFENIPTKDGNERCRIVIIMSIKYWIDHKDEIMGWLNDRPEIVVEEVNENA